MRGLILSHPAVAAVLAPYIVTWWEGHDRKIPAEILDIERQARFERHSNVLCYVLTPDGRVAGGFTPYPGQRPFDRDQGDPEQWFAAHIREFTSWMGIASAPPAGSTPALKLPDVSTPGVRLLLTFRGEMNAHVPVVEVTEVSHAGWQALAHPGTAPKAVDPSRLIPWLGKIYPPALMDQGNEVTSITGSIQLEPAPSTGTTRRAILHGTVVTTLAGSKNHVGMRVEPERQFKDLSIPGRLSILLEYDAAGSPISMRGWYEGTYTRPGPNKGPHPRPRSIIHAAIEGRGLGQ